MTQDAQQLAQDRATDLAPIRIGRSSQVARRVIALYLLCATLLAFSDLQPVYLLAAQIGLLLASGYAAARLGGLPGRQRVLQQVGDRWSLCDGDAGSLTINRILPILVSPHLLGIRLQLQGQRRAIQVWVAADAVDEIEHWRLRRMALDGQ